MNQQHPDPQRGQDNDPQEPGRQQGPWDSSQQGGGSNYGYPSRRYEKGGGQVEPAEGQDAVPEDSTPGDSDGGGTGK